MSDQDPSTNNRTPPPGIEVTGELPPGVPWWDAERLDFRWGQDLFYSLRVGGIVLAMVLTIIAADVGFLDWLPLIEAEKDVPDSVKWPVAVMVLVITFGVLIWQQVLTPRIPYLSLDGNDVLQFVGTGVGAVLNSSTLKRRRMSNILSLKDCTLEAVRAKDDSPTNWQGATFQNSAIRISPEQPKRDAVVILIWPLGAGTELPNGLDLVGHWHLLTYRIAKAKGENPPPPTFQ